MKNLTTTSPLGSLSKSACAVLALLALVGKVHGEGGTVPELATEPFAISATVKARPNILFVLDDSGSMQYEYLPDWAGPRKIVDEVSGLLRDNVPAHRFFNSSFNGIAYNAATRYRAPVMYTSTGGPDTTTYPTLNGTSTATGGDATANPAAPNWRGVKLDGFGVQSAATVNLEGSAFYYTTLPGEYCSAVNLRSCIASSAPAVGFTQPAPLRWCTTAVNAVDTTANAGTSCQASNIEPAAGITAYTYARFAQPRFSTIRINVAGTVSSITVDDVQILSASAGGATSTDVAAAVAARVNACTYARAGDCASEGYSAISEADMVTIYAPGLPSAAPVVTGTATTVSAFSGGSVPGATLFTVLTPLINSYPYPGSATKAPGRADCAGTTCTYAEEMTNYANWYAYYRTRMQMMKTSASIAFTNVSDSFRVGYASINNGSGTDFVGVSAFDGAQRYAWYSKFFAATPYGTTPLRGGLAKAGQYYAGKIAEFNTVASRDPMQYSCQQNFTILSTDGFWNDTVTPKQTDGVTDVGNQDGTDDRPYYDGSTYKQTVSSIDRTDTQIGYNSKKVEQMEQRIEAYKTQIDKTVTTTTRYDFEKQTSPLLKSEAPLLETKFTLTKKTKGLYSMPPLWTEYITRYKRTEQPLTSVLNKLRQTVTPVQSSEQKVKVTKTPLQTKVTKIKKTVKPLVQSTFLLTKTTRQLQKRARVSTNGGDSYFWTVWENVDSCQAAVVDSPALVDGVKTREVACQYVIDQTEVDQATCTEAAQSSAPNYTVARPVQCAYQSAVVEEVTGSFTAVPKGTTGPTYNKALTYAYGSGSSVGSQETCPRQAETSAPYVGPAILCAWDTDPAAITTSNATATCTVDVPANVSRPKTECQYTGTPTYDRDQETCTVDFSSGTSYDKLTKITCSRETATAKTPVASCVPATTGSAAPDPGNAMSGTVWTTRTGCTQDGTPVPTDNLDTCTVDTGSTAPLGITTIKAKADCSYRGSTSTANQPSCTYGSPSNGTGTGAIWNSYTSCRFEVATVTGTALNSCVPSGAGTGSVAGTVYSGPLVVCAEETPTSSVVSTCTPVTPVPPYSAPIVTCTPVADPNQMTLVENCTPSETVLCFYGPEEVFPNQDLCKPQVETMVAGVHTGPAVVCEYVDAGTRPLEACTAVGQAPDGDGTLHGPSYSCAYGAYSDWTNVTSGSCTWANPSGPTNYSGPARSCAYGAPVNSNVGICEAITGSSGNNTGDVWSVLQRVDCASPPAPIVAVDGPRTRDDCVVASESLESSPGVTIDTTISCAWRTEEPILPSPVTCSQTGGESPIGTFQTKLRCSRSNPSRDWIAVAGTCTETTPSDTFDATGKIVECRESDKTDYPSAYPAGPVPTASCTPGFNLSGEQITCTTTGMPLAQAPQRVELCVNAAGEAPHYVTTTCQPNSVVTAAVMGCAARTASAPLWETVNCVDNGDGTKNTLADVAAFYAKTDLRTSALENCLGSPVSVDAPAESLCSPADDGLPLATSRYNNVPTTATDSNKAQHMVTFTLGLGASGYMRYSPSYTADSDGDFVTVKGVPPHHPPDGIVANPATGLCSWQSGGLCNWPFPAADKQTTIDDLWHAAVNGRGAYFSATDPVSLATSISATLAQVEMRSAVAAAAALSNPVLAAGDSYLFTATYQTVEWTGDVRRITVDPFSGRAAPNFDWSAQSKLDNLAVGDRKIYAFGGGGTNLRPFTAANFGGSDVFKLAHLGSLAQFQCIEPEICLSDSDQSDAAGAALVNFLRGDRSNEGPGNNKFFRQRAHVLGDIVNAQVTYVSKPSRSYADAGYERFKSEQADRIAMVYAAANDGMVHAIRAVGSSTTETKVLAAANAAAAAAQDPGNATLAEQAATAAATAQGVLSSDTLIGQEQWAYIPTKVLPELYRLADKKYKDRHRYYVDATPVVGDVCTAQCDSDASAVWKTILVGGLGRGGRGYYALDITNPAAPKALWEFSDEHLGYTYGNPQIVKTSGGEWVVLLTSGYNNIPNDDASTGDGAGRLYVVHANTGVQLADVSPLVTSAGSVEEPSGLAKITAPVVSPTTDATVVAVYGGDLLGNLWRFDINDAVGAEGVEAQLFAVLKDGEGDRQPITTRPLVSLVDGKYIVLVGTGRYLHTTDAAVQTQQTFYGLIDHRTNGTNATDPVYDNPAGQPRLSDAGVNLKGFVKQKLEEVVCPTGAPSYLCVEGEKVMTTSNSAVDHTVDNGWFMDFIQPAERSNLDPALALGTLVFNTNAPSTDACDLGGKTYQYWLDYATGGVVGAPGNPLIVGKKVSDTTGSAVNIIQKVSGELISEFNPGCVGPECEKFQNLPESVFSRPTRRTSWRELIIGQ